ncbi:MAG: S-methyl-5-thioribose-1-phosphate isomerase [Terriglobia bacterium]
MKATAPKRGIVKTIEWVDGRVRLIDQTKLPNEETYLICDEWQRVATAIKTMQIRGAPAIGVAAALGIALGANGSRAQDSAEFMADFEVVAQGIAATRPTARNLFWAVERMRAVADREVSGGVGSAKKAVEAEALRILADDVAINERMGRVGAELIEDGDVVLTHCNAGALATAGFGTAVGVVRAAWRQGKQIHVFADETRPLLQGARLTAWELMKEEIPFTLITDSMAGYMMSQGEIDKVVVGADRIASNGDVANKIGTYTVAVLAKENQVPFFVAAPLSTVDMECPDGNAIPVEERGPEELVKIGGVQVAPVGARVRNPAFDITPSRYVAGIVTEAGLVRKPYEEGFKKLSGAD